MHNLLWCEVGGVRMNFTFIEPDIYGQHSFINLHMHGRGRVLLIWGL
jgi:hypothetical protein